LRRNHAGESTAINLVLLFLLAGVSTALLLPTYRNYTLHEHTRLATATMQDLLAEQRLWQQRNPSLRPTSFEALGYTGPAVYVSSDGTANSSANITSIYRISLATPSAAAPENCGLVADERAGFVMVAEPIQTQRIDTRCARLCLSSSGARGASGEAGAAACWERPQP
jgi:Tfp pilus assembly protein PilE